MRFDIDANGILSVTATDKGTGKKQDIKITGASTLPSDEVERMVKDAERNAEGERCGVWPLEPVCASRFVVLSAPWGETAGCVEGATRSLPGAITPSQTVLLHLPNLTHPCPSWLPSSLCRRPQGARVD